jgi:hypothetical protein
MRQLIGTPCIKFLIFFVSQVYILTIFLLQYFPFSSGEEGAAAQELAEAPAEESKDQQDGPVQPKMDLHSVVDLSDLDLSVLDKKTGQPSSIAQVRSSFLGFFVLLFLFSFSILMLYCVASFFSLVVLTKGVSLPGIRSICIH